MEEPDNIAVKSWKISVKAYNAQVFTDPTLKKKYQDTVYGYGYVIFRGTEKECNDYEMILFRSGVKILGTSEYQVPEVEQDLKKAWKALADRAYKKFWDIHLATDEYDPSLGRIPNGSRNWSPQEAAALKVYDRISHYYTKKFVAPYL